MRTSLETVGTFADGAAVQTIGAETFRICNELVDEMVTVSNDEICAAIKDGFTETRCVLEPAGALAIAGIKKWVASSKNSFHQITCSLTVSPTRCIGGTIGTLPAETYPTRETYGH